jgi:aryl-alcohol dehydrogenase-like predicted oxidoreductase
MDSSLISGFATHEGTEHYAERFSELHPDHFKMCHSLYFPSIGLGTYLGNADEKTDRGYTEAVEKSVCIGSNLIDSAINYRFQRSERSIGKALTGLLNVGFRRDELIICTKGGYIPFDSSLPDNPRQWVEENLIKKGIVAADEIFDDGHCLSPMFLYSQLQRSLCNLNVETVDIYYVHNPETQLDEINEEAFYQQMEMVFRMLESAVDEKKIRSYGVATWDGFIRSREQRDVLNLEKLVAAARRARGEHHHFCYIQLPVNLAMPEALTRPNQAVGERTMTILEAARAMNIGVIASASLLQGQLAQRLPETLRQAISSVPADPQRALQFVRSAPGVTSALVGMSSTAHVEQNLELANHPLMDSEDFGILFGEA